LFWGAFGFAGVRLNRALAIGLTTAGFAVRLIVALQYKRFGQLVDDSFYAFTIARNIAQGHGVTYAGELTNGFQPLFVFLAAPWYVICSSESAVLGILIMSATFGGATGWFLYRFLCRAGAPHGALLALAVWAFSPYFIFSSVNGLETGLTAFFLAVSAWWYAKRLQSSCNPSVRDAAVMGVILGFGVLSRIDLGFWAAAMAIGWLCGGAPFGNLTRRIILVTTTGIVACLVAAPWFAFNFVYFGNPLPTSGSGVRFISLSLGYQVWSEPDRVFNVSAVPLDYCLRSLRLSVDTILTHLVEPFGVITKRGFLLLLVAMGIAFWKEALGFVRKFSFLVLFPLMQLAAYSWWIFGHWFYGRYYMSTALAVISAIALLTNQAFTRVAEPRRTAAWAAGLAVISLSFLGWNNVIAMGREPISPATLEQGRAVALLEAHVAHQERVGAFQSGAVAYYGINWDVVNLDGVLNAAAKEAMAEGRMNEYLLRAGVDWLVDWDWIVNALYTRHAGKKRALDAWECVAQDGQMCLYRRKVETRSNTSIHGGRNEK
jgi:hypothetical protein